MAVKTWGDFEINFERLLGRGGMGAVYMGRQISLDRPAAIKILKSDLTSNPEFVKRFNREAALLARIVDNHVVQIFGAGEAEGQHYYAMEYVEGEDYASKVKKGHKFTLEEVLKVGESVGIALQMAWRHRIVHRDIKPSNILLTKDNETKVMDFGLAKNPESDLTASEVIMGTAKYMSPEQATGGACDIRSDLYSLGVVLYELAAGQPPFTGEGATAIMYQHVHKQPTPPRQINPSIPVPVEAMILRLMAKDPEARYPSPDALISAIRGIQDGVTPDEKSTLYNETIRLEDAKQRTGVGPKSAATAPMPEAPRPGSGGLVAGLAAAALVLGVGGYFLFKTMHPDASSLASLDKGAPVDKPELKRPDPPALDPPQKPPDPAPVPNLNPNPLPAPAAPWEESRRRGLEAFGARQWSMAFTQLEEAERLGAKDVADKKLQARANQEIEKGEAETDEEAALQHFEAARKFVDDEALRLRIKSVSFRRWRKSAEKSEGGDWFKAAEDWKRAVEVADEVQIEEARERQKFCATFAEAVSSRTSKNWPRALELYKELAKNPRGQSVTIELEIKRAETELAAAAETLARDARREYDGLLEQGRALMKRALWAEAKAVYDRASGAQFKEFPHDELLLRREEVGLALAAPPGMIYVPGGKFVMGGGTSVDGPEGEATVSPFYIDDREVRVADYAEFVKALDSFGHTPACLKEEPPNKKHVPADWESQKAEDAVVGVDWWDAASYAAWRKKRLPSEAEWERAAGFDPSGRRLYPWGAKYQKEAGKSYLGIDGMGSGVIEWTADWFQRYPWSKSEHPDYGEKRKVVRGGVLLIEDAPESTKVTHRFWYLPMYRGRKVGFRCVQDMPEK
ncbi:MAG TPA: bifunctional serine/threonine-protein kinase/formylglycine-generating enzyme family protein [Planctomycetota bacterium]|nr:bifunctional serine/threonine-protein kinase/formylglycine-generating enzyme family protein [Planctomycetota bacterium]